MRTSARSAIPAFVLAGLSLALAVATGIEWLGQPLKLVHLLTIIGLSMTAGGVVGAGSVACPAGAPCK
jgi:hypothetical protein